MFRKFCVAAALSVILVGAGACSDSEAPAPTEPTPPTVPPGGTPSTVVNGAAVAESTPEGRGQQ